MIDGIRMPPLPPGRFVGERRLWYSVTSNLVYNAGGFNVPATENTYRVWTGDEWVSDGEYALLRLTTRPDLPLPEDAE